MKRLFIVLCAAALWPILSAVLWNTEALAQSTAPKGQNGDIVSTKISVTREQCAQVSPVVPADGAAYTPGVDVNGKPVVPADIKSAPSPFVVPQNIVIDFGLDIAKRYGLDSRGYTAASKLWTLSLQGGRLYVDDKPLKREDARAIAKACRRAYGQ